MTKFDGHSNPNVLFIRQHNGEPFGRPQQIWFSSPMLRVGAFFATSLDSSVTMVAYSPEGTLLESVTLAGTFDSPDFLAGHIGLEEPGGIGHVELYSRSDVIFSENYNFSIDDLRFESVPEPGTLALLVLGVVGVIASRYRARRAGGNRSAKP